jgi:hypothetical protein
MLGFLPMFRIGAVFLLSVGLLYGRSGFSADKIPSKKDFGRIKHEIETLRGKPFLTNVPVYRVSTKELRAISDRAIDKQYPGAKLGHYDELLVWIGMIPPGTSLKSAEGDFFVDQVAGLYDTDTKEMCVPMGFTELNNSAKKATEKKLEDFSLQMDSMVMTHEFTHALEDQYWPLDDPKDSDTTVSTDRGTAHSFLTEGSANRQMMEAIPAQMNQKAPGTYFFIWNLLHSGFGEWMVNAMLAGAWKTPDALAEGVPETLSRSESMPYSFGYSFCAETMRNWGLDGLDYVYEHPPISSEQIMHPKKYWQWRDYPVQIDLPESLPGGWKQLSIDCAGESGIAVLFGCHLTNLNRGLELARGWDGDHVALFERLNNHRLLIWASSWDSTNAAARYLTACVNERVRIHSASIQKRDSQIEWESADHSRIGLIRRDGKHVIILESDDGEPLRCAQDIIRQIHFSEPAEDEIRNATNNPLLRFNPVWSVRKDGDHTEARSLFGLLSRHDRNSVGASDQFVLGLAESRRTSSFNKWRAGFGLLAAHESEDRRGFTKQTLLPWGILASRCLARLPYSPDMKIERSSILWGLLATDTLDGSNVSSFKLLPFGIGLDRKAGARVSSFHVLGTGFSRQSRNQGKQMREVTRYRFLGIPVAQRATEQ